MHENPRCITKYRRVSFRISAFRNNFKSRFTQPEATSFRLLFLQRLFVNCTSVFVPVFPNNKCLGNFGQSLANGGSRHDNKQQSGQVDISFSNFHPVSRVSDLRFRLLAQIWFISGLNNRCCLKLNSRGHTWRGETYLRRDYLSASDFKDTAGRRRNVKSLLGRTLPYCWMIKKLLCHFLKKTIRFFGKVWSSW